MSKKKNNFRPLKNIYKKKNRPRLLSFFSGQGRSPEKEKLDDQVSQAETTVAGVIKLENRQVKVNGIYWLLNFIRLQ